MLRVHAVQDMEAEATNRCVSVGCEILISRIACSVCAVLRHEGWFYVPEFLGPWRLCVWGGGVYRGGGG